MKHRESATIRGMDPAFSILNGSNGNETPVLSAAYVKLLNFQYPQRIEWQ